MWLMRIIGDCPQCGAKDSYGNVAVRRDHVLRHCKACRMEAMRPLPEIQKKVLYLDQFFFSHAFRGREERFLDAIARVQSAAHLQLLVAPYSSVHEEETRLWRGYNDKTSDELMEFIRLSTRGAKFERDYALELTQILKGFQAFLDVHKLGDVRCRALAAARSGNRAAGTTLRLGVDRVLCFAPSTGRYLHAWIPIRARSNLLHVC